MSFAQGPHRVGLVGIMRGIEKISEVIGMASEWAGRLVMWLVVVLILIVTYDVLMRYAFTSPAIWVYTLSYYIGGTFVALGIAYVHYHKRHVRIDFLYLKLPLKARAVIDIIFDLVFFFPLIFMLTKAFAGNTWHAYVSNEIDYSSLWYVPTWPVKMLVTIGFGLLFMQGLPHFFEELSCLFGRGRD